MWLLTYFKRPSVSFVQFEDPHTNVTMGSIEFYEAHEMEIFRTIWELGVKEYERTGKKGIIQPNNQVYGNDGQDSHQSIVEG